MSNKQIRTITIKEYDRLYIRQNRDLENNIISNADAVMLQSVVIDSSPVFTFGNRCLIAQQWVGVIELPEFNIEILPKLYGYVSEEDLRNVLIRMLIVSRQGTSIKQFRGSVSMQKNSLSEMLIYTFIKELQEYVQEGLQFSYQKIDQNLNKIKGRILFSQQLKRNVLSPTRFYCRYSKYVDDNELNQFFKTCLVSMKELTRDESNAKSIEELLFYFYDIKQNDRDTALQYTPVFNLTNNRAKDAYIFGYMFLNNIYATMSAGDTKIYTMLFDMNQLYELFIYRVARIIFGHKVTYQKRGDYMVSRDSDGKKFIGLRPDLTLKVGDDEQWIIDTKWKLPKNFAKESDIYQMNAYSTGIKDVSKVVLLYPKFTDKLHLVEYYTLLSAVGNKKPLEIRFIDLMNCLQWDSFLQDFKECFTPPINAAERNSND